MELWEDRIRRTSWFLAVFSVALLLAAAYAYTERGTRLAGAVLAFAALGLWQSFRLRRLLAKKD